MRAHRAEQRRIARAQRRHRTWDGQPSEWFSVQIAWAADEAALPEARQRSHDSLIRGLGTHRRGGVTWTTYDGNGAFAALARLHTTETSEELAGYYEQVRELLQEHGGFLVVAMAAADRPGR